MLRIDAMGGEGEPQERVIVTIVKAEDIRTPEELPEPGEIDGPATPEPPAAPKATVSDGAASTS